MALHATGRISNAVSLMLLLAFRPVGAHLEDMLCGPIGVVDTERMLCLLKVICPNDC